MITDVLQNAPLYYGVHSKFERAFKYLVTTDFTTVEKGRYEIDGDEIFALVNEFETKDKSECQLEAHKKHIDIQYIVSGAEVFGYTPLTDQEPLAAYNETNDVSFYQDDVSYLKLEGGRFIIFYPTDLHQPEVKESQPAIVKKVVVKIKI